MSYPRSPANKGLMKLEAVLEKHYRYERFKKDYPVWLMTTTALPSMATLNVHIQRQNYVSLKKFLDVMATCNYWKTPHI